LLKIIGLVIGALILWVIITNPTSSGLFIKEMISGIEDFLVVVIGALLKLAEAVIRAFEAAQAG